MVDALFGDDALAPLYDLIDDDRSDLLVYAALVDELGASSLIDIGCGTGTFACLLALRGKRVIGVDPARASLSLARLKPGAELVHWIEGDATVLANDLGELRSDIVTMTGNVAQVFIADTSWRATLRAARATLDSTGWLVFETRDPAREAWTAWNRAATYRELALPDGDHLETWTELLAVEPPLVTFRHVFRFAARDETRVSESTLCFRTVDEIVDSLDAAGFRVHEIRDAPDRPGREFVVLCQPA